MFGQFLVKYLVVPLAVKVLPQIAEELVQVIRGALEKEAADAVKEGPDQAPLPNPNVEITYHPIPGGRDNLHPIPEDGVDDS